MIRATAVSKGKNLPACLLHQCLQFGRYEKSSAVKDNFSGKIGFGKEYGTADKHHFAFVRIQHEVIVRKSKIELSDAFRYLSEAGMRIKVRGACIESNIISKLMV